jgi:hypothetical protein
MVTQDLTDEASSLVVSFIQVSSSEDISETRQKQKNNIKRKLALFKYARTQDLYKKNLSVLAKYVQRVPRMEEPEESVTPEDTNVFYKELWGYTPDITIPFDPTTPVNKDLSAEGVLHTVTTRDINERLNRLKKGTVPGPDGIER